jgi:hypothetical protein
MMASVRTLVRTYFHELFRDSAVANANAVLSAVPDIKRRIEFPVSGPRLVGLFYLTPEQGQRATTAQSKGLGPFPSLLTTDPSQQVAIDVKAPNFFFGGNRAEGLVLRVSPIASLTIWRHVQIFKFDRKRISYPVDLGFVLGLRTGETFDTVRPRLLALLRHTVRVWRGMDWDTEDGPG